MGFDFKMFNDDRLNKEYVNWLINEKWIDAVIRYGKFWDYYKNSIKNLAGTGDIGSRLNESSKNYTQTQEYGLPARITGIIQHQNNMSYGIPSGEIRRKEVVIENDIAWRVNAMVDFLFGKSITIISKATDPKKKKEIEKILKTIFENNGGVGFFQNMSVLGSVYGFVDCIVRAGEEILQNYSGTHKKSIGRNFEDVLKISSSLSLELIEAPRSLPILDENDYRKIIYYIQHFEQRKNLVSRSGSGFIAKLLGGKDSVSKRQVAGTTEIIGPNVWQRYEDDKLISHGINPLGRIPVIHIQNLAQPCYYEGNSDVEPLIPLQDELNTRLSDRASRITFQSFKMYLAKGLEKPNERTISPGRMWFTDNQNAKVEQFGGDSYAPSEERHIDEIREAMDKISGITPVVAGVLKNKLGNLTSAVALKMTLMGTLSKTERKKFTYGKGIREICEIALELLDKCGVYPTNSLERECEIIFPEPLPENNLERLQEAEIKYKLGIPKETILTELGYNINNSN